MSDANVPGVPWVDQAFMGDGIPRTFATSVRLCLNKYVDFDGRAPRAEYWWFYLAIVLATAAASLVGLVLAGSGGSRFLRLLVGLGVFLPHLAAAARRLHDRDRSGWWLLLGFVPLVGIIILIVWFCMRGTRGPNRFGPENGAAIP